MILNNFLYRIKDCARANRLLLIRIALYVAAALVLAWLIYFAVEKWHGWRYEKAVQALERKFNEAEAERKAAQERADGLQRRIEINQAEYAALKRQAEEAEKRMDKTTIVYREMKSNYEQIRDNPVVPACVSYADACKELAATGYPCK